MGETLPPASSNSRMSVTRSRAPHTEAVTSSRSSCRKTPRNEARGKRDVKQQRNYSITSYDSTIQSCYSTDHYSICTPTVSRAVSCPHPSSSNIITNRSSLLLPFLLPPSLLQRTSSLSTKAMASSPVLAYHIVPPPLSLSRPTSPVGIPLSEVRLRETLERASSPDHTSRARRATSPPPRFSRVQTSPGQLQQQTTKNARNPQRAHSGTSVPLASSPQSKQRKHQELYVTPPSSYRESAEAAYANSMAYKRLEQTLCRASSGSRRGSAASTRRPRSAGSQNQGQTTSPLGRQNQDQTGTPESRTTSLESTEILTPSSPYMYSQQFTPPPSPPFNAQTAARLCASIEGVVRFSDIEGLGGAEMLDVTDEERGNEDDEGSKKRWPGWRWWSTAPAIASA